MIRRIAARNFRCLRHVDLRLDGSFHLLVGPNGSGKSTLFDAISFLSDLTSRTVREAVDERTSDFRDMVWGGPQGRDLAFRLGLEVDVEALLGDESATSEAGHIHYSVEVREGPEVGIRIKREIVQLVRESVPPVTLERNEHRTEYKDGPARIEWVHHGEDSLLRFLPAILAHGPIRESESPLAPAFGALGRLLEQRVSYVCLDTRRLRQPSSSNARGTSHLRSDGSNLPWMIRRLRNDHRGIFDSWIRHLRTAIGDVEDLRVVERAEDRRAYLRVRYASGVEVPSWAMSDGTLRLMALTMLAYLPTEEGHIFMVEEPENGLHPLAIETAYQSLSSVYGSQVMMASHSPLLLRCAEPEEALCFSRDREGAANIVHGPDHPGSTDWQSALDNDLLFAMG